VTALVSCKVESSGGADAGAGTDASVGGGQAEVYPADRTQSPLTPFVVANLRAIAASNPNASDDVFAKVGDSASVSILFMNCLGDGSADLDGRTDLQPAIDFYAGGDADGSDPYRRASRAAEVGWTAADVVMGDPSGLAQEITAISPRFAIILIGMNDIDEIEVYEYGIDLQVLVDELIAAGVIPVLTSIMPRDDSVDADAQVARYNSVVRGVAQARQVPFIDFHRELAALGDHGLGSDGKHPSVLRDPDPSPCDFSANGREYGYNLRNLITLEALDRLREAVVLGGAAPDQPVRSILGTGTSADPVVVDHLPFSDVRDPRVIGQRTIDTYPGCDATQNESGPELFYRLDLEQASTIQASLIDGAGVDMDLHLLSGIDGDSCIERAHQGIEASLDAGTYYLVADSFVSADGEQAGEYLLTVIAE
jgi:hypothetical protein